MRPYGFTPSIQHKDVNKTSERAAARLDLARGGFARDENDVCCIDGRCDKGCCADGCCFWDDLDDMGWYAEIAAEYRSKVQPPPRVLATLADAMRAA